MTDRPRVPSPRNRLTCWKLSLVVVPDCSKKKSPLSVWPATVSVMPVPPTLSFLFSGSVVSTSRPRWSPVSETPGAVIAILASRWPVMPAVAPNVNWPAPSVTFTTPPRLMLTLAAVIFVVVPGELEAEVAGERLARDRQADAGARDADELALGQVQRERLVADVDALVDLGRRLVDRQRERAGDVDRAVREVGERDGAAEAPGEAAAARDGRVGREDHDHARSRR